MLLSLAFAGLISVGAQQTQAEQPGAVLPDVEVYGRSTPEAVRAFVEGVAAPASGRGLARWEKEVCPGVVNLERSAAQAIVDRIVTVAAGLEISTGDAGCDPNLVIIFTDDGSGVAQALAERDRKVFRQNVSGLDRGTAAFRSFLTEERPVRWWSLSVPIDSRTGQRATRVPGDMQIQPLPPELARAINCSIDCPISYAPIRTSINGSRINSDVVDHLYKSIVIVDTDQIGSINTQQLGDYLAFVSLAQVDSAADVSRYDTILNVFTGGDQQELTDWDRSYLAALYSSWPRRRSAQQQAGDTANLMTRTVQADRTPSE